MAIINCADCGLELDSPEGELCPACGSTERSVTVQARAASVLGFAGHADWMIEPGAKTWEERWKATLTLADQVQTFYARGGNNSHLKKVLDDFFLNCWHLWDAVTGDNATLPLITEAVWWKWHDEHARALKIASAYANYDKHFSREPGKPTADILNYRSTTSGIAATIRYKHKRKADQDVDALQLVIDCITEWRAFFSDQGIIWKG